MDIYMPEDQVKAWQEAASRVYDANAAISGALLTLLPLAEPGTPAAEAVKWLESVEDTLRGAAYHRFAPQSEWMGGPPDVSVTKHRWPHEVLAARKQGS